jgi:hypothetical protein
VAGDEHGGLVFSFVNLRQVNGMGWNGMEMEMELYPWG